jgi:hypothetical protein
MTSPTTTPTVIRVAPARRGPRPAPVRHKAATMTPLDKPRTLLRTSRSTGKPTICGAYSADGVWSYQRTDHTGTPWKVTHLPSGVSNFYLFGTLNAARAWTFDTPAAVDRLRVQTLKEVSGLNDPPAVWLRGLRHLTGRMIPASKDLAPEARCGCDGWLVQLNGLWTHLDVCAWCETEDDRCQDWAVKHGAGCDTPAPAQCDHPSCTAANVLPSECEWDHKRCCGCCRYGRGH